MNELWSGIWNLNLNLKHSATASPLKMSTSSLEDFIDEQFARASQVLDTQMQVSLQTEPASTSVSADCDSVDTSSASGDISNNTNRKDRKDKKRKMSSSPSVSPHIPDFSTFFSGRDAEGEQASSSTSFLSWMNAKMQETFGAHFEEVRESI